MLLLAVAEKSAEAVREYCREELVTLPIALAPESVLDRYGHLHEVPVTFVIGRDGRIRWRFDGVRDPHTYVAAIEATSGETTRPSRR